MAIDPFDLLGLPASFDLDQGALQAAYLEWSGKLHPDAARADPEAEAKSAAVNEARQALENPESRADALLRRLGGPTREQERGLPPGFLAEIMGVREELESDARTGDPAKLEQWDRWAQERRRELIAKVGGMFAALGSPPDPAALRAIRVELNVWRYIERMMEQIELP